MKRLLIIYVMLFSLPLSGCKTIYNNYKEIEQLLVIQTMGLDEQGGGVLLSLASAAGSSGSQPRRLSAAGESITTAMERIYNYSYEEQLFLSHAGQLIIGEEAAEAGIDDYLGYISRTPAMRLDMPMFVVIGGRAEDAVKQVGDGKRGISEILESVEVSSQRRGDSGIYTAADVLRDSMRWGSALICALECTASSESSASGQGSSSASDSGSTEGQSQEQGSSQPAPQNEETPQLTAAANGFAVIREGKLCRYLTREQAIAVGLLRNNTGISDVQVTDKYGDLVVLEIDSGSSRIKPRWSSPGQLQGLDVQVEVRASVIEISGGGELGSAEYTDHLTAQLEALISGYVTETLQASKELKADFLGLASAVEKHSPESFRLLSREFPELLPELELTVTVSGHLRHTNDMKDS